MSTPRTRSGFSGGWRPPARGAPATGRSFRVHPQEVAGAQEPLLRSDRRPRDSLRGALPLRPGNRVAAPATPGWRREADPPQRRIPAPLPTSPSRTWKVSRAAGPPPGAPAPPPPPPPAPPRPRVSIASDSHADADHPSRLRWRGYSRPPAPTSSHSPSTRHRFPKRINGEVHRPAPPPPGMGEGPPPAPEGLPSPRVCTPLLLLPAPRAGGPGPLPQAPR